MADRKRVSDEIAARVVVAAGKEVGKKALDRILPPGDGDADEEGENKPKRKRRGWLIAGGFAALFVVIGLVGLVMAYWQWFLLAGILGLAGLIGYYRLRRRLSSKEGKKNKNKNKNKNAEESAAASTRAEREPPKRRIADDKDDETAAAKARAADVARLRELEAARDAAAERETREREVDDELAAMKARIKAER